MISHRYEAPGLTTGEANALKITFHRDGFRTYFVKRVESGFVRVLHYWALETVRTLGIFDRAKRSQTRDGR